MKMQFLLLESPQRTAQHQRDWKETTKQEYKTKLKMASIHGVTATWLTGNQYFYVVQYNARGSNVECVLYGLEPSFGKTRNGNHHV